MTHGNSPERPKPCLHPHRHSRVLTFCRCASRARRHSQPCVLPGAGLEPMKCCGDVESFTSIMVVDHDVIPSSVARLCAP
eukprot:2879512-Prymnesium_polylepis.1